MVPIKQHSRNWSLAFFLSLVGFGKRVFISGKSLLVHRGTKIDPNCCSCLYHYEANSNDPKPQSCKRDIWSIYRVIFLSQNEEKEDENG